MSETGFTMVIQCLKTFKCTMPKIIIPEDRQIIISSKRISVGFRQILVLEVAYISYNTGTHALPDIYALALGRCAPSGIVHIYQATHSCLNYSFYIYFYIYRGYNNDTLVNTQYMEQ